MIAALIRLGIPNKTGFLQEHNRVGDSGFWRLKAALSSRCERFFSAKKKGAARAPVWKSPLFVPRCFSQHRLIGGAGFDLCLASHIEDHKVNI